MQKWLGELIPGTKILYDGEPITWYYKSGKKCSKIFKRGNYVVTNVCDNYVYLKRDIASSETEYAFSFEDLKEIYEFDFEDLTNIVSVMFQFSHNWYINKPYYIDEAKRINSGKATGTVKLLVERVEVEPFECYISLKWLKKSFGVSENDEALRRLEECNTDDKSTLYTKALREYAVIPLSDS